MNTGGSEEQLFRPPEPVYRRVDRGRVCIEVRARPALVPTPRVNDIPFPLFDGPEEAGQARPHQQTTPRRGAWFVGAAMLVAVKDKQSEETGKVKSDVDRNVMKPER